MTFKEAFDFTMTWEVGPFWNPNLPEVQQGLCQTKMQQLRTGYVNNPKDPGGETKFGIAKKSHPNLDIQKLTLADAMKIYEQEYYQGVLAYPDALRGVLFDIAVNHGAGQMKKMFQKSDKTVSGICDVRETFYRDLVKSKPALSTFLNGWLKRNEANRQRWK